MPAANYIVFRPSRASSSRLVSNKATILCNSHSLATFIYPSPTAVDIFAATAEYEVISEPGDRTLMRGRVDVCYQYEDICNIPAGGKRAIKKIKRHGRVGKGVLIRIPGGVCSWITLQPLQPPLSKSKICNFPASFFTPGPSCSKAG